MKGTRYLMSAAVALMAASMSSPASAQQAEKPALSSHRMSFEANIVKKMQVLRLTLDYRIDYRSAHQAYGEYSLYVDGTRMTEGRFDTYLDGGLPSALDLPLSSHMPRFACASIIGSLVFQDRHYPIEEYRCIEFATRRMNPRTGTMAASSHLVGEDHSESGVKGAPQRESWIQFKAVKHRESRSLYMRLNVDMRHLPGFRASGKYALYLDSEPVTTGGFDTAHPSQLPIVYEVRLDGRRIHRACAVVAGYLEQVEKRKMLTSYECVEFADPAGEGPSALAPMN